MSEAPEKIWAAEDEIGNPWWSTARDDEMDAYIRADLVEAAVKRAIEACAVRIAPHPDHDKADWSEYAWEKHRNATYIRALAQDPEAIAKIVEGS